MDEKLKVIVSNVKQAYDFTELVPASGAALDRLAEARQAMRNAYRAAQEALKKVSADG